MAEEPKMEVPEFKVARLTKPDGTIQEFRFPLGATPAQITEFVNEQMQQFMPSDSPLGLRMKAKFAQNQEDELRVLKKHYNKEGEENVRLNDGGKIEFRERKDQFWKSVNPVGFDLGDLAEMAPDAPEMVLGTLGAIGGAMAGNAPGAVLGGAVGGMMGRGTKMMMGDAMGVPQPDPGSNLMGGAAIGGLGELGGRAAYAGATKILAPFAKSKILPEAQAAIDWMDKYLPRSDDLKSKAMHAIGMDSPRLMPAEATESRALDFLSNISEFSVTGGGAMALLKSNRAKALDLFADDFANQYAVMAATDPQTLGTTVKNIVEGNFDAAALPAQAVMNAIEKKIPNVPIDIKSIKRGLLGKAKTIEEINGFDGRLAGDDIVAMVMGLDDNVSFLGIKELRTRLLSRIREYNTSGNKGAPGQGLAQRIRKELDAAIDTSLTNHPQELLEWRTANAIYKDAEKQFNNKFLKKLINMANPDKGGNPEGVVGAIFRPGKPSLVELTKAAVDPPTFRQLTGYMLHDKISKSYNAADGILDADKLTAATVGPKGLGEKTMKVVLGDNYDTFTGFLNALKRAQDSQNSGLGKMFIQLNQAGTFVSGAGMIGGMMAGSPATTAGSMGTGGFFLAAPWVTSKLMTTRLGMRLLTKGISLPQSQWAKEGPGIVGRLLALQSQMADVESLSDLEAEERTTIGDVLPTKKIPALGPPSPFSSVAGQPQ